MKRVMTLILALLMIFTMFACSAPVQEEQAAPSQSGTETAQTQPGADAARDPVDGGDRRHHQQDDEGDLVPVPHADALRDLQPDSTRARHAATSAVLIASLRSAGAAAAPRAGRWRRPRG